MRLCITQSFTLFTQSFTYHSSRYQAFLPAYDVDAEWRLRQGGDPVIVERGIDG